MESPQSKQPSQNDFKNLITTPSLTLRTNPLLNPVSFYKKESMNMDSSSYSMLSSDANLDKRKKQVAKGQNLSALVGKNSEEVKP